MEDSSAVESAGVKPVSNAGTPSAFKPSFTTVTFPGLVGSSLIFSISGVVTGSVSRLECVRRIDHDVERAQHPRRVAGILRGLRERRRSRIERNRHLAIGGVFRGLDGFERESKAQQSGNGEILVQHIGRVCPRRHIVGGTVTGRAAAVDQIQQRSLADRSDSSPQPQRMVACGKRIDVRVIRRSGPGESHARSTRGIERIGGIVTDRHSRSTEVGIKRQRNGHRRRRLRVVARLIGIGRVEPKPIGKVRHSWRFASFSAGRNREGRNPA